MAIALLGQDQTTEKDSTHASATAGLEVTKDIRDNDCRIVEGCLNRLIDWICGFNFAADTPRPQFVLYTEEAGDKTLAEGAGRPS
ncbi:phage portal protein family protein [Neisseria elongata]|uniref:phage portal protein family protein n=1 Tax=Neisseria elongata TaxID=495 RepID=UPI001D0FF33D